MTTRAQPPSATDRVVLFPRSLVVVCLHSSISFIFKGGGFRDSFSCEPIKSHHVNGNGTWAYLHATYASHYLVWVLRPRASSRPPPLHWRVPQLIVAAVVAAGAHRSPAAPLHTTALPRQGSGKPIGAMGIADTTRIPTVYAAIRTQSLDDAPCNRHQPHRTRTPVT